MRKSINTPATLYNYHKDPVTKEEGWYRTVLYGVHWENNKAVNVITSGLSTADGVTIFIWDDVKTDGKEYVSPKKYASLPSNMIEKYWTLEEGKDRMITGIVYDTTSPVIIDRFVSKYDDCMTVKSVDRRDFGSKRMHHWEVNGS